MDDHGPVVTVLVNAAYGTSTHTFEDTPVDFAEVREAADLYERAKRLLGADHVLTAMAKAWYDTKREALCTWIITPE